MDANNGNTAVAEPSPATAAPAAPEVPTGAAEYTNWRMTGKLPETPGAEAKPKTEAAAPSKKSSAAPDAETHAPAPEAESTQERKPRDNAATRLNELLADLKRAGLSPAELKSFKREAQAAQTEQPKPEHTAKPAETKADPAAPVRPEQKDYDAWEKFEAARDKYHDDVAEYRAQKAVNDYQARQQQQSAQQQMTAKFAEAKQRYGDEAETTIVSAAQSLAGDAQIPMAVKAMFEQSDVMTDLLYVMGAKPAEFEEFLALARSNPAAAIRKMVLTESLVSAELAKTAKPAAAGADSKRDETGKFSPAKKVTEAPPPPREASGRSAPPADEAQVAAGAGDFTRFKNAANRRDLARRTGH